jgi:hypothetical protein
MPCVSDSLDSGDQPPGEIPVASPSAGAAVPGTVLATAILLGIGGVLTVVYALAGVNSGGYMRRLLPSWGYALYGLLYVWLGWAVRRGRPWARRVVLVLCGIGAALALLRVFFAGPAAAVTDLAWPAVYAVLLNTESARSWFKTVRRRRTN